MDSIADFIKKAKQNVNKNISSERQGLQYVPKDSRAKGSALASESTNSINNPKFSKSTNPLPPQSNSVDEIPKESNLTNTSQRQKRDKILRRFNFDWNENDDTSQPRDQSLLDQALRERFSISKYNTISYSKKNPFEDINWKEKPLDHMTERDWRILKEDFNIITKGGNIPRPIRFWQEAPIQSEIKDIIFNIGYVDPTPIQRQAIPVSLLRRDLIGIAETGSGKTASFLIPLVSFIMRLPLISEENASLGPYALIIAPTRELAQQIEHEAVKFCRPLRFRCVSIVGGKSFDEQSLVLRAGTEIVIGTPGRLKDCLERRMFVLSQCTYLVLDEADRMMDMGFETDVNFILDTIPVTPSINGPNLKYQSSKFEQLNVPKTRQTTMFSATMRPEVEKIAKSYMNKPVMVNIGNAGQAADAVQQIVEMVSEGHKKNMLLQVLRKGFAPPIIVFVNQKANVDILSRQLENDGFRVVTLHGGKAQDAREASLSMLKTGRKDILIATDVAGRGIDIPDVSLVINYDMPKKIEDYVHRIGRTGRAGKSGKAITFLTLDDADVFYDLKQLLMKSKAEIPTALAKHEASKAKPGAVSLKRKQDEIVYSNR